MGASVTKVGTRWRITYDYGGKTMDGKRNRSHEYVKTEKDAIRKKKEFIENQKIGIDCFPDQMKVAELLEKWLEEKVKIECEKTTLYGYSNIVHKHLTQSKIGKIKVQSLKKIDIHNYYHELQEKGLSKNTVRKHYAVLKQALDFAQSIEIIYRNVAAEVKPPEPDDHQVGKTYTPEQVGRLLELVRGTKLDVAVHLAVGLGLRREEIMGLKWEKIDWQNRLVHIVEVRTAAGANEGKSIVKAPKTRKSRRTLYLFDAVYEALLRNKAWQDQQKELLGSLFEDSGYVVVRFDGKPYRVNSMSDHFLDFLKKHDLPHIRFHDLRHTCASLMHYGGVGIKEISGILGHSNLSTTSEIYTHLLDETFVDQLSVMNKYFPK